MRLFAALPLPATVTERLLGLCLRLSDARDGLRWSSPQQWHITLQFYGEVSPEAALRLQAALDESAPGALEVALQGLGRFAAKGLLFASVAPSPALTRTHTWVSQAAQSCGLFVELRPFHPHITLARSKGKVGLQTLDRLSTPELPPLGTPMRWTATECHLLASTLQPGGAEYEVVHRTQLLASSTANGRGQD